MAQLGLAVRCALSLANLRYPFFVSFAKEFWAYPLGRPSRHCDSGRQASHHYWFYQDFLLADLVVDVVVVVVAVAVAAVVVAVVVVVVVVVAAAAAAAAVADAAAAGFAVGVVVLIISQSEGLH